MKLKTAVLAWLFCVCTQLATAGPVELLEKAQELYDEEQYAAALRLLEDSELSDSAEAMVVTGDVLWSAIEEDHGIRPDRKKAIALYEKAASMGSVEALDRLGWCYYTGAPGIPSDMHKAEAYWSKAVAGGNTDTILDLVALYIESGSHEKITKAVKLLEPLLDDEVNDLRAHHNLGKIFTEGIGGVSDVGRGIRHYEAANAHRALAQLYYEGRFIQKDLEKALAYMERANLNGPYAEEVARIRQDIRRQEAGEGGPEKIDTGQGDYIFRAHLDWLKSARERIALKPRQLPDQPKLTGTRADLEVLQRLIDEGKIDRKTPEDIQALGVAFSDIVCQTHDMHWRSEKVQFRDMLSIRYQQSRVGLDLVGFFERQVEANLNLDLQPLFREISVLLARSGVKEKPTHGDKE